jgi:hypothetical protein
VADFFGCGALEVEVVGGVFADFAFWINSITEDIVKGYSGRCRLLGFRRFFGLLLGALALLLMT